MNIQVQYVQCVVLPYMHSVLHEAQVALFTFCDIISGVSNQNYIGTIIHPVSVGMLRIDLFLFDKLQSVYQWGGVLW